MGVGELIETTDQDCDVDGKNWGKVQRYKCVQIDGWDGWDGDDSLCTSTDGQGGYDCLTCPKGTQTCSRGTSKQVHPDVCNEITGASACQEAGAKVAQYTCVDGA